uniref:MOSC domain-containing protein n=1 Tax=Ningiella ruwaisensis TaxID=2364274 RepID=UPI0010A018F9|nr:MOSC domain-containing protein [Ningiella ruwaisensis]
MEVTGLFAGKPQPFGPRKAPSSIIKQAFDSLSIEIDGAIEDEQGNKKLHGGPEMAVHQYAQASYLLLQQAFPEAAPLMQFGSIGENISAPAMNESNVCIGDVYQMGSVVLQVSSPRAPCAKINHRYKLNKVDHFVLQEGITGWYYRVLEPGILNIGDVIKLKERNERPVSVRDVMFMTKAPDGLRYSQAQIEQAVQSDGLAPEWQEKLKRKLR